MNLFIVAIGKIIVVEALAGLLLASFLFEKDDPRTRRWFTVAFGLIFAASTLAYFNFATFRFTGGLINRWEHYHFFLGSKYLPEIRYDGLYEASAVALNEQYPRLARDLTLRDLGSFELEPAFDAIERSESVKSAFSPARWQEFKSDLTFFFRDLEVPLRRVLMDHGNTGSPAWATLARLFTGGMRASQRGLVFVSFLDVILLALLAAAILRIFGARAMFICLSVVLLVPRAYDYLGGSILRLDWLIALGSAACLLARQRYKSAGIFIAYAIASKPFCALFAAALGCKYLIDAWRTRSIDRTRVELVAVAALALVAIVLISSLAIGDSAIWPDYIDRILVNLEEKYYSDNYSFRDIFLQLSHEGVGALYDWTPRHVAASLPQLNIGDFKISFFLARAALLALLAIVISRHDDELFAFGMGALFVWVVFVTNMYYWQMLLVPVLAFARGYRHDARKLVYLLYCCLFFAASYLFVHFGSMNHLQGFFGSWCLVLFCVVIGVTEAIHVIAMDRPGDSDLHSES